MAEDPLPLNETIEISGFAYDPEQDIFYSIMDAWQRKFGFCRLYDIAAAPFGMIVDCEPVYFKYGGRHWLVEFWKGQYDLTTGGEMGIYWAEHLAPDIPGVSNLTFYESGTDADLLDMSFFLEKNGEPLFSRADRHWWLTGFKLGEFSEPSELVMKIGITFKDEEMCGAFVEGMQRAGYADEEIERNGDRASFVYDKPRTHQPYTRVEFSDWLIQGKNKYLCLKYQEITGNSNTIQEKLEAVKEKDPAIYDKITSIGMPKDVYEKCMDINSTTGWWGTNTWW